MDTIARFNRKKKRRILALSAASRHTGMQCLYLETEKNDWRVIEYQCTPYPSKIRDRMGQIESVQPHACSLAEIAALDWELSHFFIACGDTLLQTLPRKERSPDLAALNRYCLWRGKPDTHTEQRWNVSLGDPQPLATALRVSVLFDFLRHDILSGGYGAIPAQSGDRTLARRAGALAVFVNIGLLSRLTIIDTEKERILVDCDTGPGACLIDRAARDAGCEDGFDRDGSAAQQGHIDTDCLETLAQSAVFTAGGLKSADAEAIVALYEQPCLRRLSPFDRLATVTALTARTVSNYYYAQDLGGRTPAALYVSGGGSNNLLLLEFLSAYFSPIPVKNIEELGAPAEGRIPLSLALTVNDALDTHTLAPRAGSKKAAAPLGKWIFP
jgi:anhydro-N-acetylmuramic acid kinase